MKIRNFGKNIGTLMSDVELEDIMHIAFGGVAKIISDKNNSHNVATTHTVKLWLDN